MPELGEKIRFRPAAFVAEATREDQRSVFDMPRVVTGKIVYINKPHRWYDVAYECNGVRLREGFKF